MRLTVQVASAGSYRLKFYTTTANTISINGTASLSGGVSNVVVGALNTALEKCEFTVNFTTDGADTLTLDIVKTAGSSNIFAYEAFTLKATVLVTDLQVAASAACSTIASNQSFQLPFGNVGGAELIVTNITRGGADAAYFTIDSFTSPVAPGGGGNIAFTFNRCSPIWWRTISRSGARATGA